MISPRFRDPAGRRLQAMPSAPGLARAPAYEARGGDRKTAPDLGSYFRAVLLFVREHRSRNGLSEPFLFLGPGRYAGHSGSLPMSITWELMHQLPARLCRQLARLAVA
jgi:hypothetical protein